MALGDPTKVMDVTSLLDAFESSGAEKSSAAPPGSGLRLSLRQTTADDPSEAADITSLLALFEKPSQEEPETSAAPAPTHWANLRRRLQQTMADDPSEAADFTSLLALVEEPSEEVEVSVAPGPGPRRHLLQQVSHWVASEPCA